MGRTEIRKYACINCKLDFDGQWSLSRSVSVRCPKCNSYDYVFRVDFIKSFDDAIERNKREKKNEEEKNAVYGN